MTNMIKKLKSNLYITLLVCFAIIMSMTINQICNMPCCQELIETACCDPSSSPTPSNTHSIMNVASDDNHCSTIDNHFSNIISGCNHIKNKVLDKKIISKDMGDIALTQNLTKEYYPILLNEYQPQPHNSDLFHSFLSRSNTPLIC